MKVYDSKYLILLYDSGLDLERDDGRESVVVRGCFVGRVTGVE
jgi:hypothetical protein